MTLMSMKSSTALPCIPEAHKKMVTDIVDYRGAVVLVCGDTNTGKSTFCRFLVNSLLNRYDRVGFLECDVGQTEFTVSMVTALHLVTTPMVGPSHADQRKPYKAFFYGHPSPADKPCYYVRLIQQLHTVFMSEVHNNREVPLIINTCGWTTGMGVAILMDIIRLTSPSHLVRMVPDTNHRTYQPLTDLLPFTPHTLTSTPGILTQATPLLPSVQEEWCLLNTPGLVWQDQRPVRSIPNHTQTKLDHTYTKLSETSTVLDQMATELDLCQTTPDRTVSTVDSSETTPDHTDHSCEPVNTVSPPPPFTSSLPTHTPSHPHNSSRRARVRRRQQLLARERRRLRSSCKSHHSRTSGKMMKLVSRMYRSKVKRKRRSVNQRGLIKIPGQLSEKSSHASNTALSLVKEEWSEVESCMLERWVKVMKYSVTVLRAAPGVAQSGKKNSRMMRRLALMAHFGSLSSGCGDHTHFLDSAPVLQVAWSDIAIHVLDKQVPRTDMMCAMKGNYIALCRVDPNEVVEEEVEGGGRVQFLCSHTPIITFLAMGVFHGFSTDKQLYYVTTPLDSDTVAMDTVNALVMGKVEPRLGFPETTPTNFHPIPTGQFAWK